MFLSRRRASEQGPRTWTPEGRPGEVGQGLPILLALLLALVLAGITFGSVARALQTQAGSQSAADVVALAGARTMLESQSRLFEPARVGGRVNPAALSKAAYLARAKLAVEQAARRNGIARVAVSFPDAQDMAPGRIHVRVLRALELAEEDVDVGAAAEAEVVVAAGADAAGMPTTASGGGYSGPLAYRQGKPMRPDVAQAFDRMAAAARKAGVGLVINSAFRSDAEQARLFAAHPDPKWVAPPGKSLHRMGTELDLGPSSAYGWLAANGTRFGFKQRYSWEPWHYGYFRNAASRPETLPGADRDGGKSGVANGGGGLPSFVPARFAPMIARAAQRYNVSAVLLSAQLWQESKFNPLAVSRAGAQGLAQFMPATAAAYGLRNPFDPAASIDAQARMMRELLQQFGAVSLALAAYNAGPGRVSPCMCVPPIAETQTYVRTILQLMGGADPGLTGAGLEVRLVR